MIVTNFVPKQGICTLTPESPDDLWTLRRLIANGDTVVTRSSRVSKREGEYSRPDKGERISVVISLLVEKVSLDSSVDRLRVRGHIIEASDENVSKVGSHSIIVSPGYELTLQKQRWTPTNTAILRSASSTEQAQHRFLLVAIDRREAGIGLLAGSHLDIVSTVESGASGKGSSREADMQPFFRKVVEVLKATWRDGDRVAVAGPGNVKLTLENMLRADTTLGKHSTVLEGFDLAGSDGVRALLKFEGLLKVAADSVLVEVQETVAEAIRRLSTGGRRIAYTMERVTDAAAAGAVDKCVVSDDVFAHQADEDKVVQLLNLIEEKGGRVFLCDTSLEAGKQVSSLGGIVALLRYDVVRVS